MERVPIVIRFAALLVVATTVSGACTGREAEVEQYALGRSTAVTFTSTDGVELAGRVFGPDAATAGVVLAHMLPADQRSWYAFAERLGALGYRALTFDFRGYCPGGDGGCSKGERNIAAIWQDVQGAVAYLRDHGSQRVALVGASMGGTASLIEASRPEEGIDAVATLSAPTSIEGLTVTPQDLQAITAAKLFVAGNGDATAATAAQDFYNQTLQPKRVEIYPSDDHGTDLLSGNQSENVRTLLLSWLQQYAPIHEAPNG
jgi:pimeloyl-ACP methyl ester carboxylesterase